MKKYIKEKEAKELFNKILKENNIQIENELYEMATITSGVNKDFFYKVAVYNESNFKIPHLHFYKTKQDLVSKKGGCIRLDKPEYFSHGSHIDKLNSSEIQEFIVWLAKPNEDIENCNNYKACISNWNANNQECKLPLSYKQPDYKNLK